VLLTLISFKFAWKSGDMRDTPRFFCDLMYSSRKGGVPSVPEAVLPRQNGRIPIQQKKGGVQIRTPPQIKIGSTQAALRPFVLIVFLSRFAANSLATAFWSFSVSTR